MKYTKTAKRIAAAASAFLLAWQTAGGKLDAPNIIEAAGTVSISPYSTSLVNDGIFEGWGTSLCWWANRVGYSDSLAKQTGELFFGDTGLRMNIARFNIGGGDNPSHNHITRTELDYV